MSNAPLEATSVFAKRPDPLSRGSEEALTPLSSTLLSRAHAAKLSIGNVSRCIASKDFHFCTGALLARLSIKYGIRVRSTFMLLVEYIISDV